MIPTIMRSDRLQEKYVARVLSKFSPEYGDARRELVEIFLRHFTALNSGFHAGTFVCGCYKHRAPIALPPSLRDRIEALELGDPGGLDAALPEESGFETKSPAEWFRDMLAQRDDPDEEE